MTSLGSEPITNDFDNLDPLTKLSIYLIIYSNNNENVSKNVNKNINNVKNSPRMTISCCIFSSSPLFHSLILSVFSFSKALCKIYVLPEDILGLLVAADLCTLFPKSENCFDISRGRDSDTKHRTLLTVVVVVTSPHYEPPQPACSMQIPLPEEKR